MYSLYIFDVDGTLTTTQSGETFRKTADDWHFLPGRIEKCRELVKDGATLVLASNQGGVAFPWSKFSEAEIRAELEATAAQIGAQRVYVCCTIPNPKALPEYYHVSDTRRKPGPGMLLEAMTAAGVSPQETLMVGDRTEDEGAARAAGVDFIWADTFFAG